MKAQQKLDPPTPYARDNAELLSDINRCDFRNGPVVAALSSAFDNASKLFGDLISKACKDATREEVREQSDHAAHLVCLLVAVDLGLMELEDEMESEE